MRLRAVEARDRPGRAESELGRASSTPGSMRHCPARRSPPNQATTIATRSRFGHIACRSSSAASTSDAAIVTWRFSARRPPGPERLRHGRGLVAEFGRAGNERHRAEHALERADRPHDFEGELRNAIGEGLERQPLEHRIGEPAIGGRIACALLGDDQRIGASAPRSRDRTRTFRPERSSGLPSAQMRAIRPIGPSHRPTATLAK